MKGLIEKLWDNQDRKGNRYLVLQIGEDRYSLWDQEQMNGLEEGLVVEYEWKQAGKYRNLTKVEAEPNYSAAVRAERRDQDMVRMSCLKSAAALLAPCAIDPDTKGNLTLDLARRFEKYILDGKE